MGGLIGFLMKTQKLNNENIQTNQNRGSDFQLILNTFHIINMEGVMKIDQNAFQSLQIFKTEEHPSSHSIGKSKEGLNLFILLFNLFFKILFIKNEKRIEFVWDNEHVCDSRRKAIIKVSFYLKQYLL